MGLRSPALLALLAVVTVLLLASLLRWWPALGRRGVGHALRRAGLLAALQVSVLSLLFVWVNRSQEFYASWSDLLGTSTAAGQIRLTAGSHLTAGDNRPAGGPPAAASPVTAPASVRPLPAAAPRAGGRLQAVRFTGPVSGISASGEVFLPPGYPAAGRRLPVTVVLSQTAGSPTAAYGARRIAAAAAAGMASGRIPRMILVIVSPAVAGPADPGCLDVPGGPQATAFFTQDLPQAVRGAFRASVRPGQWAVLGGPGGGYCALQLATAPAGAFAVAAAPSAISPAPPGLPVATSWLASQDNLAWRLRHWPPPPLQVLFTGPGPAPALARLVRPPMRAALVRTAPGGSPLAAVLTQIGQALASR